MASSLRNLSVSETENKSARMIVNLNLFFRLRLRVIK